MTARGSKQSGFALVAVLWGIAGLSLIAAVVLSSTVLASKVQKSLSAEAIGMGVAEAGIVLACRAMLNPGMSNSWHVDGHRQRLEFAKHEIFVTVQDEFGLIDLNAAGFDHFRNLFLSAGAGPDEAESFAGLILDWRSPPGSHHMEGVVPGNIPESGRRWRPRNGPFQSVDEVLLLPGMTRELFDRIEPALTVFSQKANVDPATAPRDVLVALPGMTEARISEILESRRRAHESGGRVLGSHVFAGGRAFEIRSEAKVSNRLYARTATVRLAPGGATPCLILSWK